MSRLIRFWPLLAFVGAGPGVPAAVIEVDPEGSGGFGDLRSAVEAARDGDTVLVQPGEYSLAAPLDFRGKKIAVKSAGGPEATVLRLAVDPADPLRASLVVFENGEGEESILEGFTLTGGRGNARCADCPRRGGAIWCVGASPTLKNLHLRSNRADSGGALFLTDGANPAISDSSITENEASVGGGIYSDGGSSPRIEGTTISENRAATGGGLYLGEGTRPVLQNCEVSENRADEGGGLTLDGASPRIIDSDIAGNEATLGAGFLIQYHSAPQIEGSRISGNAAESVGGAVFSDRSSPRITNTTITHNSAESGSAFYAENSALVLDHSTVYRNEILGQNWPSATMFFRSPDPATTISSSILWGNRGQFLNIWSGASETFNIWERVSWSCIEFLPGELQGPGNVAADPLFCGWQSPEVHVDASKPGPGDGTAESPYRRLWAAFERENSLALLEGSPCIGAGEAATNMGAQRGTCGSTVERVLLKVGPGTHRVAGLDFSRGVSLEGAGWEETTLIGTVDGLLEGSKLSGVTVSRGRRGGVIAYSAEIRDCRITGNEGHGIQASGATAVTGCIVSHNTRSGIYGPWDGSTLQVTHSTVAFNQGVGIEAGAFDVRSSIVWENTQAFSGSETAAVEYSCVQGGWEGEGNISADPLFCGWGETTEAFVDASRQDNGDGSPENPFKGITAALRSWDPAEYRLSLREGSPCLGSAEEGSNMGADSGTCAEAEANFRHVARISPGSYSLDGVPVVAVDLIGSGREKTFLSGGASSGVGPFRPFSLPVSLRAGATLSDLSVTAALKVSDGSNTLVSVTVTQGVVVTGEATCDLVNCLLQGGAAGTAVTVGVRSSVVLDRCTVAGSALGLSLSEESRASITNSIIWRNGLGVVATGQEMVEVRRSCIQEADVWPGEGNLNVDPRFCGWNPQVDVASSADLAAAIEPAAYRYSLALDSPCLQGGDGASPMGAELGTCPAEAWVGRRIIRIAPGSYNVPAVPLSELHLAGSGRESTTLAFSAPVAASLITDLTASSGLTLTGHGNELRGVTIRGGVACMAGSVSAFENSFLLNSLTLETQSSAGLRRSTVAGSPGYGIVVRSQGRADIEGCIIWRNLAGGIDLQGDGVLSVRSSCIQGPEVWPGEGNLNVDPRFCGWKGPRDFAVTDDAGLQAALSQDEFDYGLRSDSTCLTTGVAGSRMGADLGICEGLPWPDLTVVRVAPGTYTFESLTVPKNVRIAGASREATFLSGDSLVLSDQSSIEDLTIVVSSGMQTLEAAAIELRGVAIRGAGSLTIRQVSTGRLVDCSISEKSGSGLRCLAQSIVTLEHCTVARNRATGVEVLSGAAVFAKSCIIWGNLRAFMGNGSKSVTFSCIQGGWPGQGNIGLDPLFCGFVQIHVDASAGEGGTGSPESPLQSIQAAPLISRFWRISVQAVSPCLGTGEGGSNMGAAAGTCEPTEMNARWTIRLGPGSYSVDGMEPMDADIIGSGRDRTSIGGPVVMLGELLLAQLLVAGSVVAKEGTSNRLDGVTVTDGVVCEGPGTRLDLENCLVKGGRSSIGAIYVPDVFGLAPASTVTLKNCTVTGATDWGLYLGYNSAATVTGCIIWRNKYGGIGGYPGAALTVSFSCVQTPTMGFGQGNLSVNPRFCGLKGSAEFEVSTDADLDAALSAGEYEFGLRSDSPCLVSGPGGGRMGADLGTCEASPWPWPTLRLVRLAPGRYTVRPTVIQEGIRVVGAGRNETILSGELQTLSNGASLEDLTAEFRSGIQIIPESEAELRRVDLRRSVSHGISLDRASRARLVECSIAGNSGPAISCAESSVATIERCTLAGNGTDLDIRDRAKVFLVGSIVWANQAGGVSLALGATLEASFSCLEGETPWPGPGNINLDPLLCGWTRSGGQLSSLNDLEAFTDDFRIDLTPASPCIGAGLDGGDMGAPAGRCSSPGAYRKTFFIGPGTFPAGDLAGLLRGPFEIRGAGQDQTILRATPNRLLLGGASLSNLTVQGGLNVAEGTSPFLVDCTVRENREQGIFGVVCAAGSRPTFRSCRFVDHVDGAIRCDRGSASLFEDCLIAGNAATTNYTFLMLGGLDHRFVRCEISGNTSSGGIFASAPSVSFTNCSILGNNIGTIKCISSSTSVTLRLEGCLLARNEGPAVTSHYTNTDVFVERCTIADYSSQGIQTNGGLVIRNSIIWGIQHVPVEMESPERSLIEFSCIQDSPGGTGVISLDPRFCRWSAAEVYVDPAAPSPGDGTAGKPFSHIESAFALDTYALAEDSPCLTAGEGGTPIGAPLGSCGFAGSGSRVVHLAPGRYPTYGLGLWGNVSLQGSGMDATIIEGSLRGMTTGSFLSDLTITNGTGGRICHLSESPEFIRCRITGNRWGEGAIILSGEAHPTFESCEIVGNQTAGLVGRDYSSADFVNCLISGNREGGIVGNGARSLFVTMTNCTVADNPGPVVGFVSQNLKNCITSGWQSVPAGIASASSLFEGFNLPARLVRLGNLEGEPLFVSRSHWDDSGTPGDPLDDVFIPGDYRLRPESLAINSGTAVGAPSTDLDGNARPCHGAVDIGAYEYCGAVQPPPRFLRGDPTGDGAINITDPIHVIFVLFGGEPPPPCMKSADADDNGAVDITDAIRLLVYLFRGGAEPPPPFPGCGVDTTDDDIPCEAFVPCI